MAKKTVNPKFAKRINDLYTEAHNFLNNSIKKGKKIVFATEKDLEKSENLLYDLDMMSQVGKHGNYDEYSILSIERNKENKLVFHCAGRGEQTGEREEFTVSDLTTQELIYVADSVVDKLK